MYNLNDAGIGIESRKAKNKKRKTKEYYDFKVSIHNFEFSLHKFEFKLVL